MSRNLAADLARLAPNASKAIISGIVANQHLLDEAGINTPIRLRHFFARVCVETGGMKTLEENLNYSASRMTQVWPKRFPTIAAAKPYANNPAMLAEKVYGGRLGNNKPGDGWAFRGSGLLQDTGRDNFEEVEAITGMPVASQPDLLRTFPGALQAATIYWKSRNINARADRNDVAGVCKAVNGGTIGLSDQRTWLAKAEKVWPDSAAVGLMSAPAAAPVAADPMPVVPDPPTKEVIQTVQNRLRELGYNPGDSDGKMGPLTRGAILSFKNDADGLTPTDTIDEPFLAALAVASPRKMAPDRANATISDVAGKIPEARVHWWTRLGAGVGGVGAGSVGLLDQATPAIGYLSPVKDFIGDVPSWVWVCAFVGVCAVLAFGAQYGAKKATDAFRAGERR
jgi:putative chitinase